MDPIRVYDYLTLSRSKVFDWVRPLSSEQYRQEHPIGLGSLARTMHHMMAAEWLYMERVRGKTLPGEALERVHDPEVSTADALAFAELEPAWTDQAAETRQGLLAVKDWHTSHVYETTWEGQPYAYRASPGDFFSQLALHEVHHRAQVLHMLKRLGVETEEIDFNALMWERVESPSSPSGNVAD